jgi:hypothetical protein
MPPVWAKTDKTQPHWGANKGNPALAAEFSQPHMAPYTEIRTLNQSDPTDHALAAIASILDQPEHREPERPATEEKPATAELIEADGYQKMGPGPIEAIRFKWTVRHEAHDRYYVDETIGDNSQPITSGPMSKDAAISFVDERESEAQLRFERLKSEMIGRSAASALARKDSEI